MSDDATCHVCRRQIPQSTGITTGNAPRSGDVSLCVYCGSIGIFNEDGIPRSPTGAELRALRASGAAWEEIKQAQDMIIRSRADERIR